MIKRTIGFIQKYFALFVVIGAYAWSALAVMLNHTAEMSKDRITLRIGHWQLESGVRDALNIMAAEYQKIHPEVHIIQDAVPETVYSQWVNTQLMGGTAPDMIELGRGVSYGLELSYYARYYIPLTRYVDQPNPYNKGTSLEAVPLCNTYKDGMMNAYVVEMQQYMGIPLSMTGIRIFYNKDLLKQLTGKEEAPTDYRAFLDTCKQIMSRTNEVGQAYIPIAASKYHFGSMWEGRMSMPLTYSAIYCADFNRDAYLGTDELFLGLKAGYIDFNFPAFRAKFQMTRELADCCQKGFTGLSRDDAVFLFAQQQAVFIATGSWDARSLMDQAQDSFRVGIMDFPIPSKDDPEFGPFVKGRCYEQVATGFKFGITRTCRHPDIALDFLLFLAGQKQNEKLNKIIGWIPAIVGTDTEPFLKAFEPHLEGVYNAFNPALGGETYIKWAQLESLYQIGLISYDELVAEFQPFFKEKGYEDWLEQNRDWRRGMYGNEQLQAALRAKALLSDEPADGPDWINYRIITVSRQLLPEIDRKRKIRFFEQGIASNAVAPYEYTLPVLDKIRQRMKK